MYSTAIFSACARPRNGKDSRETVDENGEEIDERLRNIEPRMIETIMNEMLNKVDQVTW